MSEVVVASLSMFDWALECTVLLKQVWTQTLLHQTFSGTSAVVGTRAKLSLQYDTIHQCRVTVGSGLQLDSRRTPAPQVSLKTQDALSSSYYSARHECNVNRARAEGDTEVHFYHGREYQTAFCFCSYHWHAYTVDAVMCTKAQMC